MGLHVVFPQYRYTVYHCIRFKLRWKFSSFMGFSIIVKDKRKIQYKYLFLKTKCLFGIRLKALQSSYVFFIDLVDVSIYFRPRKL